MAGIVAAPRADQRLRRDRSQLTPPRLCTPRVLRSGDATRHESITQLTGFRRQLSDAKPLAQNARIFSIDVPLTSRNCQRGVQSRRYLQCSIHVARRGRGSSNMKKFNETLFTTKTVLLSDA